MTLHNDKRINLPETHNDAKCTHQTKFLNRAKADGADKRNRKIDHHSWGTFTKIPYPDP